VLAGVPLTPAGVRRLGWLVGAGLAVGLTALTGNPLIGLAFGWMGLWMPEAVLRTRARRQWRRLDVAAYAAAHMLHAKIQAGQPVLEAWRAILPDAGEPFRSWMQPALTGEAQGVPLEETLKARAAAIQHVELGVLADVLAAERAHGRTAPVVAQTVRLWSQRIQADATRRGTLAAGLTLGYAVVGIGVVVYWGILLGSPVAWRGMHHGLGFVATGIGALLVAWAGWIQNRVLRQAEAV